MSFRPENDKYLSNFKLICRLCDEEIDYDIALSHLRAEHYEAFVHWRAFTIIENRK